MERKCLLKKKPNQHLACTDTYSFVLCSLFILKSWLVMNAEEKVRENNEVLLLLSSTKVFCKIFWQGITQTPCLQ